MDAADVSPARVVAQLLIDLAICPAFGGSLPFAVYVGDEPDLPDAVVTVFDTDRRSFGRVQPSGEVPGHDGFQVRVRAGSKPVARRKLNDVATGLSLLANVYQTVVRVAEAGNAPFLVECVSGLGDRNSLGRDRPASARSLFTTNGFLVWKPL